MKRLVSFSSIVLWGALLFFVGTSALLAQEGPPDNVSDTWIVVPKAGHGDEFEEAFKKHIAMRKEKGDVREWRTYVPVTGDDLNFYVIRYCCFSWKDMDDYVAWGRSAGTVEHWADVVDQHVENYEHYYGELDIENSNWPDPSPAPYVGVTSYRPKMGEGLGIAADKKALSTAAKEMNWPYSWFWGTTIGGEGGMMLAVRYANYAAMAPPEKTFVEALSEKMGAEEAGELFKSWASHFDKTTYTIYQLREDLSMGMEPSE